MGGAGTTASTRKARSAETEAALKDAAKRVFARTGYLKAKITDITAEAGRAAGSFYSHFGSKEDLLEALLVDMVDANDVRVEEPEHSPDFTDPAAVRWHVEMYWRFFSANRSVVAALHQAALVDPRFADRLRQLVDSDLRDLASHLEHIRAAGGRLPGDPLVVASAMMSLMNQFAAVWLTGRPPEDRSLSDEEAVDTLTAFIVHGISGPPQGS